jgi:hypothetical protein
VALGPVRTQLFPSTPATPQSHATRTRAQQVPPAGPHGAHAGVGWSWGRPEPIKTLTPHPSNTPFLFTSVALYLGSNEQAARAKLGVLTHAGRHWATRVATFPIFCLSFMQVKYRERSAARPQSPHLLQSSCGRGQGVEESQVDSCWCGMARPMRSGRVPNRPMRGMYFRLILPVGPCLLGRLAAMWVGVAGMTAVHASAAEALPGA